LLSQIIHRALAPRIRRMSGSWWNFDGDPRILEEFTQPVRSAINVNP